LVELLTPLAVRRPEVQRDAADCHVVAASVTTVARNGLGGEDPHLRRAAQPPPAQGLRIPSIMTAQITSPVSGSMMWAFLPE
jgi:hypothetical protein